MLFFTLIGIITFLSSSGQIMSDFTKTELKGFTKVVSKQTIYNQQDSSLSKFIYYINDSGEIFKTESYDENGLTNWTSFEYNKFGLTTYEESHSITYGYDENGNEIRTISNDSYNARIFKYMDSLLVKIIHITSFEGSKSSDYVINYEYDKTNNLVTETFIDGYQGLTGDFKSNSTKLDSMYVKKEISTSLTKYRHTKDSIIATSFDNNKISGYTFTVLNEHKRPTYVLVTNSKKESLQSYTTTYNDQGKIDTYTVKIIDADKIEYDHISSGITKTSYNKSGLPIKRLTIENNKVIVKQTFNYY